MMNLSEIKQAIADRKLTQVEIAARMGVGQARVSEILRTRNPSMMTLERLEAAVLGPRESAGNEESSRKSL